MRRNFSADLSMAQFGKQHQNRLMNPFDRHFSSAFAQSGLALRCCRTCRADQAGEVEIIDLIHCINAEDAFGFITKDFAKVTVEGRQFINKKSHDTNATFKPIVFGETIRLRQINQRKDYLEISVDVHYPLYFFIFIILFNGDERQAGAWIYSSSRHVEVMSCTHCTLLAQWIANIHELGKNRTECLLVI